MIAPISSLIHQYIGNSLNEYDNISVLDMGGTGKMGSFTKHPVKSVNLKDGTDCTKMSFQDNSFDISVSVAVLEHVDDQNKFIEESIRVSKLGVIHWFPVGEYAKATEELKSQCKKYNHPCVIPPESFLYELVKKYGGNYHPLMTCGSHLLSLMTMKKLPQNKNFVDFIVQNESKPYGYCWVCLP